MSTRSSSQKRVIKMRLFGGRSTAPCCFCSRTLIFSDATLEHVRPLSKGGGWSVDNIRLSCSGCNTDRGVQDFVTYRQKARMRSLMRSTLPR